MAEGQAHEPQTSTGRQCSSPMVCSNFHLGGQKRTIENWALSLGHFWAGFLFPFQLGSFCSPRGPLGRLLHHLTHSLAAPKDEKQSASKAADSLQNARQSGASEAPCEHQLRANHCLASCRSWPSCGCSSCLTSGLKCPLSFVCRAQEQPSSSQGAQAKGRHKCLQRALSARPLGRWSLETRR